MRMQPTDSATNSRPFPPADLAALQQENAELKAQLQSLQQQLDWFKKQIFGSKSEKRLVEPSPGQASLFDGLATSTDGTATLPTEEVTYTRRKGKQREEGCVTDQGLRFDADVPIERIELSPAGLNEDNRDQYEIIGEKITRRLAQRPGSYVVLEYVRPVIRHKASCELVTVPAPLAIFDGCMADVSVLAGLLVDKFVYHLPLYRQHRRLQDAGITLSRATLTYWVQRTIDLLTPLYDAQFEHILLSKVLAMDDDCRDAGGRATHGAVAGTPIKAGRKKKGKMQSTWFWPIYGEDDELAFTWSTSRGSAHVEKQLQGFAGILLTDGYSAYDCFVKNKPEVTLAQCWTHTRRYFVKAEAIEPEATAQALDFIGALYQIEEELREKEATPEKILKLRGEKSLPIVDRFFGWCHEQSQRLDLTPTNPLVKALNYVRNHQEQLKVYLGDPLVSPDTNHLERALRVIPMGRKNWNFCWTEAGAEQVGIIQSLLTTCRLHGVDPYTYLVDVLQRLSLHPARDVIELTPRVWKDKFAKNPLKSDLGLGQ